MSKNSERRARRINNGAFGSKRRPEGRPSRRAKPVIRRQITPGRWRLESWDTNVNPELKHLHGFEFISYGDEPLESDLYE